MVLEDEPNLRKFLRIFLTSRGHEVVFDAGAGHVGLERLKRAPGEVDVILSDLRMPIADGFDVLAGARALEAAPVVIASAYWTSEEVALARDLGAFALLAKPFDLEKLAKTVADAAEASSRHKAIRQASNHSVSLGGFAPQIPPKNH
jgi:two-component system KDP operon response regulator KdpE